MRIFITTPVFPPDIGGPATYVPNLAKYLHEKGHKVRVLTFLDDNSRINDYPFRVIAVKRIFLPIRYFIFFAKAITST